MAKRVLLATRDLLFRAKLAAAVVAAGASVTGDERDCDLVVLELEGPAVAPRIRKLRERGIQVLGYAPHVRAELLRIARDAGAVAVPNSAVAARLEELLA